ncbi:toprim domain-containing protein [Enterococcus casseliflavus]|uniref:toprim domain-containing protein n=1 Tax=Enterococcus casseliflavus TaxID=37734 RepID=UPI0034D2BD99
MRFLNEETIDEFAAKKLISSDDYGNLVYRISDVGVGITGHYVGAEIQGTIPRKLSDRIRENHKGEMQLERKYFKGTALNSKTNRGFLFGSVTSFKDPLKLIVTEAPLEALSFYELHKDKLLGNHWHLSLNGLKEQTLWHTAKALKEMFFQEKLTIILALNNDEKGLEAIKRIHETYQQSPQHKERYKLSLMLPDLEQGDWNEVLEVKKTGSLASRSEKEQDQQKALALFEARQKSTKEAELQL